MRKYQKLDIEGAILDEEQLKKHMEKIAIQHTLKSKSDKNTYPIPQMLTNYGLIKSTYNLLNEHIKLGINIHPAGEWILDNFYIVEESVRQIEKEITLKKYTNFVGIQNGKYTGFARIYVLANEIVAYTDNRITGENLEKYLQAYQTKKTLNMEEIWNIGVFLQIAIIQNIADICEKIYSSQIQKYKVKSIIERLVEKKDKSELKYNQFSGMRLKGNEVRNMKYPFIEYMSYSLKKYGKKAYGYLNILEEEVEKLGITVSDAIQKEHFATAIRKITMRNCITSIKTIQRINFLDIFEKINQMYEANIHPMFQSFTDGVSEIISVLLDGYNEYISPLLDNIAEKFQDSWKNHIYPAVAEFIEFIGKVADLVKVLWEKVLQPFLKWIAQNIFPVIAPVIEKIGEIVLNAFDMLSDVIGGILRSLGGVIDFVVGVFTGDWERAWQGIADIFGGIWDSIVGILRVPVNAIIDIINTLVSAVASGVNGIADMLNSISIPEEIPVVGGLSFNFPNWTPNPIPHLAQGGYVKKNTPQLAMIGDNLHQGELVAPENKLQAMVNAAVATVAGTGGISRAELESIINSAVLRIVAALSQMGFYLDGELMAKAVKKAQENLDMRYNPVKVI